MPEDTLVRNRDSINGTSTHVRLQRKYSSFSTQCNALYKIYPVIKVIAKIFTTSSFLTPCLRVAYPKRLTLLTSFCQDWILEMTKISGPPSKVLGWSTWNDHQTTSFKQRCENTSDYCKHLIPYWEIRGRCASNYPWNVRNWPSN